MTLEYILNKKLFYGDSLKILREFPNSIVDLIYIDVPFFTQKEQKTSEYSYKDIWKSKF